MIKRGLLSYFDLGGGGGGGKWPPRVFAEFNKITKSHPKGDGDNRLSQMNRGN